MTDISRGDDGVVFGGAERAGEYMEEDTVVQGRGAAVATPAASVVTQIPPGPANAGPAYEGPAYATNLDSGAGGFAYTGSRDEAR